MAVVSKQSAGWSQVASRVASRPWAWEADVASGPRDLTRLVGRPRVAPADAPNRDSAANRLPSYPLFPLHPPLYSLSSPFDIRGSRHPLRYSHHHHVRRADEAGQDIRQAQPAYCPRLGIERLSVGV